MKIRTSLVGLIAFLISGYVGTIGVSKGQAPSPPSPPAENSQRFWYYDHKVAGAGQKNLAGSLRQAADAVHNAKGDEEASAAKKKLTALIDKYFDEDMKQREKELLE